MPANVESMFYVRQAPWHGLGVRVEEAPSSQEALRLSSLDWQVIQQPIATVDGTPIPGYRANLRDTDQQVLGVVQTGTGWYKMRKLCLYRWAAGEGVKYETAGSTPKRQEDLAPCQTAGQVHHRRGPGRSLPGVQQLPRRQRFYQGGHDSYPCGVPEHFEPGALLGLKQV